MFDYITTSHYGRCVKQHDDWYVKSFAVNRLYYIHQGNLTVLLDNIPYSLTPGRIYLIPQNLKFELVLCEDTRVDHTFFDFLTMPAIKMDRYIEIDPQQHPLIDSAARILFDLAEKFPTYGYDRNEYSDVTETYLANILFLIHKVSPINTINDARINHILEYIHKNYHQEITLEKLTEITNLEKNYLIRLFKQYMNVTPYQYIKKYRFNVALTLIKRKQSLTSVALRVGYGDISSFSHAFKQIYGIYPSEISRNSN